MAVSENSTIRHRIYHFSSNTAPDWSNESTRPKMSPSLNQKGTMQRLSLHGRTDSARMSLVLVWAI